MCTNFNHDDPFAHLDDALSNAGTPARQQDTGPKHACDQCGGSGKWRRGANNHGETKCFACNGRGWFRQTKAQRMQQRMKRQESKARRVADAMAAFCTEHPDLLPALIGIQEWNSFARSMVENVRKYGALTENQINACNRMLAKIEQRRAERAAQNAAAAVQVDLSAIRAMFETAMANGRRKPTYRAEGIIISRAPDHGSNAGALYVKNIAAKEYGGKLVGDDWKPVWAGKQAEFARYSYKDANGETVTIRQTAADALAKIAANPSEAAVRYGHQTGQCGVCGKKLTNSDSIEAGIGPICAEKMGF